MKTKTNMGEQKCIFVTEGVLSDRGKGMASVGISSFLWVEGVDLFNQNYAPHLDFSAGSFWISASSEIFIAKDVT
jgi:CTP synthase (UTP-ammonia lyase)